MDPLKTPIDFSSYFENYDDFVNFVEITSNLDMSDVKNVYVRIVWTNIEEIMSDRAHKKVWREDKNTIECYCEKEGLSNGDIACRVYDV